MKIKKEEIMEIRHKARQLYLDFPVHTNWDKKRDELSDRDKVTISYVQALSQVLDIEIDVEYFKEHGKGYIKA